MDTLRCGCDSAPIRLDGRGEGPAAIAAGQDHTAEPDDDDGSGDVGLLEISMLDEESIVEIGEDGTLNSPLLLTDGSGNFIVDIDSGTRLTGSGE